MRMKVILTLAVLLIIGSCDDSEKLVGNPPILVHPCNGSKEIIVTFEPSLSQEENQYRVTINKSFINQSKIEIILDANANVTMSDNDYARVSNQDKSAVINFFKDNNGTTFAIKGFEKVPYITSLIINNEQHCSQPSIGFLDKYIVANKDNASSGSIKSKVNCGRRNLAETKSVLNKTVVKPEEWPWHVTIYRSGDSDQSKYFEGTLISKNFVITVADAVTIEKTPYEPNELSALLLTDGVLYEEIPVKKLYIHDEYDSEYLIHNVALLELKKDVVFNNYIQPVCLWNTPVEIERRSEYKGTVVGYDNKGFLHNHIITSPLQQTSMTIMPRNECVPTGIRYETFFSDKFCAEKSDGGRILCKVVGWGIDQSESLAKDLHEATMPIASKLSCILFDPVFYSNMLSNDKKFCAGLNNGTAACNGDSGGGFMVFVTDTKDSAYRSDYKTGAWYVRGIVSVSLAQKDTSVCDPTAYTVFTDVAKYQNWIMTHMN